MTTRQFYDTFFQGNKENEYGHFSFTILLCSALTLITVPWLAGIIGWGMMFALELTPRNQFSWKDVLYNTYGTIAFLTFHLIKELL
jgi:hypothetical protein